MATITLSIPDEMKARMEASPNIKWSEVFRQGIIKKLEQLKKFNELVRKGVI